MLGYRAEANREDLCSSGVFSSALAVDMSELITVCVYCHKEAMPRAAVPREPRGDTVAL